MAEIVRRRSWGGVLPLGRHASISGSSLIQYASDSIAHSSFQEEQNARHHNRFKFEQALATHALPMVYGPKKLFCNTISTMHDGSLIFAREMKRASRITI